MKQIGLEYRNHKISINGDYTHIEIDAAGALNCSRSAFEEILDAFPEVLQIQEFNVFQDGKEVSRTPGGRSLHA